ncbi:hypothetical protein C2E23DRAFT_731024 [Lenzites betulinus]|nr:hypothetical protein C2E23DRAFT_731024 [Lenzites betulinus]
MFTPPPSPEPRRVQSYAGSPERAPVNSLHTLEVPDDLSLRPHLSRTSSSSPERPAANDLTDAPLSPKEDPYVHPELYKKRTGRRIKWAVVLVPFILALVGLSTRYLTHPAAFDVFRPHTNWESLASSAQSWRPHKRHPNPAPAESATTVDVSSAGSSLSVATAASATPTASSTSNTLVPATAPQLPTPFPQPFDQSLSTNFTTVGCQTFFTNMTVSQAFRSCRPFSLLVSDSDAFIKQSQGNVSLLNTIIWGTCNTVTSSDQCSSNMAWFADNIKTQCKGDISANNPIVQDAVAGLEAYDVMRAAGCQINADTNTYCYLDAVQSTHPSDLYLYQLALGLALPNTTVPSCTPCVQSIMKTFSSGGTDLDALQKTYPAAAQIVDGACGADFVASMAASGTGTNGARSAGGASAAAVVTVGAGMLLGALLAL